MPLAKTQKIGFPGFIDAPTQWATRQEILGFFDRVKPLLSKYPCLKDDVLRLSKDSGVEVPYPID